MGSRYVADLKSYNIKYKEFNKTNVNQKLVRFGGIYDYVSNKL